MLNALLQQDLEEVRESFKVDNIEAATWCFRKLTALKAKKEENNSLAYAEIQRIEAWRAKENGSIDDSISYFEGLVMEYYRELRAADEKAKLTTPYGKISSRKTTKWNYTDETETIKYLSENGHSDMIRVKQELDKAELKKCFKNGVNRETGEVIPGIELSQEESIKVEV